MKYFQESLDGPPLQLAPRMGPALSSLRSPRAGPIRIYRRNVALTVHCAANIDVDRVTRLLEQIGAPATAVVTLDHMHRRWIRAGVNGIPIGSTFNLLLRLYFLAIEGDLRLHGLEFARIVDDFRIRCCSPADGLEKQAIVADLLSAYGFRLNAKKTMIFRRGGPKSFLTHTRLKVASKLKRGLLRPFLATNSMRPIVGSWAIRLLGAMNQMRRICPL